MKTLPTSALERDLARACACAIPPLASVPFIKSKGQGEMQKVSVIFHDQTFKKFVVKYRET